MPRLVQARARRKRRTAGAALYLDAASTLKPLLGTGRRRSVLGHLEAALGPSEAVLLERNSSITVTIIAGDPVFASATAADLAEGANRVLVGDEVLQFTVAEPVHPGRWILRGLLRGRGGTELAAQLGHSAGTAVTLIDESLVPLDSAIVPSAHTTSLAAISRGDDSPVYAGLENAGATRRPLAPVHPKTAILPDGSLELSWTRRSRGAWDWPDEVETRLVEQVETYRVGIGPVLAPAAVWTVGVPSLVMAAALLEQFTTSNPGANVWVRQVGSYAQSDALLLATLD